MKKRIIALLAALILTLFCLPLNVFAEENSGSAVSLDNNSAADASDDLARYGLDEEYSIVPCHAGCSAVDLNGSNGKDIMIYKAHRKTNQRWKLKKVGDYYAFVSVWNDKVIDIPNADAVSGKELQGYRYNGTDAQLWKLESMGDGTYSVHSKMNDSLVWDVSGASWNDNTRIMLYPQHRYSNQRFRFVHTSTVEPMSDWGASRRDCNGSNWSLWDGTVSSVDWYHNHSNENDLYINSAADLGGLISLVMNNFDMNGKTIHLMCDINLNGIHWTPIGFNDHWFRGSFNGHNHAIIGLKNTNEDDCAALFGKVSGGTICNLAVKGTIKGNYQVGGIVGLLENGHVCNVYSEVNITNATGNREGGIVGAIAYGGLVDHCTQNATVNSNDRGYYRGGIAGYSDGFIRYCVNNKTVNHNWSYAGGIVGQLGAGFVEYCANHGTVGGGYYSDKLGGICGEMVSNGLIFGCYNDGQVYSANSNYDYVGGICGNLKVSDRVIGCINMGRVYGDDEVGGIVGAGNAVKCFNGGVVTGDEEVGGIGGDSSWALSCYVLAWSSANISGKGSNGGDWAWTPAILSGEICHKLNNGADTYDIYGITNIFSQNIGSDPYPTFGSSPVTKSGDTYSNDGFRVTVDCERGYGSVEGAGAYKAGDSVKLTAKPAAGCVFDHFEVKTSENTTFSGWNGTQSDCPTVTTKSYTEETITLTENIKKSYTVRAVFKIFDETPEDMKVTVKLELECTDDAGGWNSDILPVDLVDSAGALHRWDANRNDLDGEGEKISHDFDLGTTSPVAVYVTPDFGGGITFRSYGLKARMWVNGSGKAIESTEVTIRSWPFASSKYGGDYMCISFENTGNSTVGDASFTTCNEAWEKGRSDSSLTIRLDSAWLLDRALEVSSGQTVNLDLNGYPIVRTIKKTQNDGELFKINEGATLNISDSTPTRKTNEGFLGGSVQGGRSYNTGGLIECLGTLNMTGGTLYNGGTNDNGGAIKLSGSAYANLNNVLISNCWSDKAITYQNCGGAIYMRDKATADLKDCTIRFCRAYDYGGGVYLDNSDNRLNCENVTIHACSIDDNYGGGVYQHYGETHWVGGKIAYCRADESYGGGVYQHSGKAYFEDVSFEENYAEDDGGAYYCDSYDGLWFINCSMTRNRADNYGGALYMNQDNIYMENCSVVSNAAKKEGGGIYTEGAISVGGKVVIRNNDGEGSMDNLVLQKGALIHDLGLEPGSEIHLRSDTDGNVKLGGSLISEYQMNQYFRADYGRLELIEAQAVDTNLRASVFSEGKTALIIGGVVLLIALIIGIIYKKKQKGGAQ